MGNLGERHRLGVVRVQELPCPLDPQLWTSIALPGACAADFGKHLQSEPLKDE
jgi:hypothetical protein